MSILVDYIMDMDSCLDAGDTEGAHAIAAQFLQRVDQNGPHFAALVDCLRDLATLDRTDALDRLRSRYRTTGDEHIREIITWCGNHYAATDDRPPATLVTPDQPEDHDVDPDAPTQRYTLYGTDRAETPIRTARNTSTDAYPTRPRGLRVWLDYREIPAAMRDALRPTTETNPSVVRDPHPDALEPENITRYFAERFDVDDEPNTTLGRHLDQYDGYTLDNENTPTAPLSTLPCVACHLERRRADVRTASKDDGLCPPCRAARRPGIPTRRRSGPAYLNAHTAAVYAACEWITARYPTSAPAMIAALSHQSTGIDRAAIRDWTKTHPATTPDTAPTQYAADNVEQFADHARRAEVTDNVIRLAYQCPRALGSVAHAWHQTTPAARAGLARARHELVSSGLWEITERRLTPVADRWTVTNGRMVPVDSAPETTPAAA